MTSIEKDRPAPVNGLTVFEVIERLRTMDPHSIVVVEGRYGGFDAVKIAEPLDIALNVNEDPDFGPHDIVEDATDPCAHAVALICRPRRNEG